MIIGLSHRMRSWHGLLPLGLLWLFVLIGLSGAYAVQRHVALDVGHSFARPHLRHFFADEAHATTYAYSGEHSALWLPGVGADAALVTLALSGWRPAEAPPAQVTVTTQGHTLRFTPRPYPATYQLFSPPGRGDLTLTLHTNAYQPGTSDTRRLGIPLDRVVVAQLGRTPPWTTATLLLMLATSLWLLGLRLHSTAVQAALAAGGVMALLILGLALARLFITVALARLLVTTLLLHLLLWPLPWLLHRLLTPGTAPPLGTPALVPGVRSLWVIFAIAFIVRVGGVLSPHIQIFDEAAHTGRVERVLAGRFAELYYPSFTSFMGHTVGIEGGHFPYSPLWYLVVTPFTWVGLAIGDVMNGLNAVLDSTKILLLFALGQVTMRSQRAALLAASMYAVLLMPLYLLSWGNYPTQFGLWSALLALTFLVVRADQPWSRRTRVAWVGLLVLCILSYTITGIFMGTLLVFWALLEQGRRRAGPGTGRWLAGRMVGGLLIAELLAFAVYHIHFAGEIARTTVPALFASVQSKSLTDSRPHVDARESPLSNLIANSTFLRNHTGWLVLGLALIGLGLLYRDPRSRRWWPLWSAWLALTVSYSAVSALVADMVLKHLLFLMPLLCLAVGSSLDYLWTRWRQGRYVVGAIMLLLTGLALERWYVYLVIKRHY